MQYKLKELREKKHMTQEELSKRSGVSRATICGLENGGTTITKTNTLVKLAAALNARVSDVFLE